jgi:hypothetical protein
MGIFMDRADFFELATRRGCLFVYLEAGLLSGGRLFAKAWVERTSHGPGVYREAWLMPSLEMSTPSICWATSLNEGVFVKVSVYTPGLLTVTHLLHQRGGRV